MWCFYCQVKGTYWEESFGFRIVYCVAAQCESNVDVSHALAILLHYDSTLHYHTTYPEVKTEIKETKCQCVIIQVAKKMSR